jgi:hypothetical protein
MNMNVLDAVGVRATQEIGRLKQVGKVANAHPATVPTYRQPRKDATDQ